MSDTFLIDIWQKSTTSLLVTFATMLLLIPLARRLQLLDFPAGRKDHANPTPVIGGLAMSIGIFATWLFYLGTADLSQRLLTYAIGGTILIVIGQLDDKYDLPWWLRICAQTLAAIITTVGGDVRVEHLGPLFSSDPVSLGEWSIPFTVFATVGLINALNMIDGMDGFAGSLALTTLVMLAAAAFYSGNISLVNDVAVLCGALLAFLCFNLRFPWRDRAKVFMGNGGSAFLGFTIAWVAFQLTQTPRHPVTPTLALWLVPIPVIDCLVIMTHRIRRGHSPFKADHNHIHHLMRDAGIGPMRAVIFACLFSVLLAVIAAGLLRVGIKDDILLLAFTALLAAWYWLTSRRGRALRLLRCLPSTSKHQTASHSTDTATRST